MTGDAIYAATRWLWRRQPADENLRRIERRQTVRAIDEHEFELRTFAEERDVLTKGCDLGEPFDVSAPPPELVAMMLHRLQPHVTSAKSDSE